MELECPECGAMNEVDDAEQYSLVDCYMCEERLEIVDNELLAIDNGAS